MSVGVSPLEIFRAKGIPHRRMEDWKYSDLRAVLDAETVAHAGGVAIAVTAPQGIEQIALGGGDLLGWAARSLATAASDKAMDAAARAFAGSGVALRVPGGVRIAEPLRVEFTASGHGHIVLLLEAGASLTFVETHRAHAGGLRNIAVSIVLEEGAELIHIRQAPFAGDLVMVETVSVFQEKNARYTARLLTAGAKLSRVELAATLAGRHAEADLSGVSVLGGAAHADITTRIDHAAPDTTSRQLFKKVAGGRSRAVYQGKITVREGAIGSDSRQTAKALLLGHHAEADLKPELEILADDVKCAHGAAVGDLDQDSLFYLRARGIPEAEARALLVHAFLVEVIDGIADENLRDQALTFVDSGLAAAMGSAP